MALASFVTALSFLILLPTVELSTAHFLKGNVSCLDCHASYDLSGTVVMVKCDKVDKVVTATTGKDGFFEAELHPSSDGRDCEARLAGGPNQIYAATNTIVAGIVRGDGGVYGISTPLAFCTACRSISSEAVKYCKAAGRKFGSSKTFNLPLPPEWGLAPSSYYFPFFPIIGVP